MSIYSERLKNLRNSKNRDRILAVMEKVSAPMTIDEIFTEIKKEQNSVSLSTIYRIIDKLKTLNIVRVAAILDDNKARYELVKKQHHHYMICKKCKKMIPIDICPIEDLEHKIAASKEFTITDHKFELYGKCKDCTEKERTDSSRGNDF